jgi:hypothetical protein
MCVPYGSLVDRGLSGVEVVVAALLRPNFNADSGRRRP